MELSNVSVLDTRRKILLNTPHIDTSVGDLVTFNTDLSAPLKSCKVSFLPVQEGEGDPSPDNVRNITGWDGVSVTRCGKNLFDPLKTTNEERLNQHGELLANYQDAVSDYIKIQSSETYTISNSGVLAFNERHCWYDKDKNFLMVSNFNSAEIYTLTAPSNAEYIRLTVKKDCLNTVQFELSSEATSYESHQSNTISIDWTNDVGTVYGGYVDLVSGELVGTHLAFIMDGVNHKVSTGAAVNTNNNMARGHAFMGRTGGLENLPLGKNNTGLYAVNKYMIHGMENGAGDTAVEGVYCGTGTPYIRVVVSVNDLADVSGANAILNSINEWLTNNPVQICYTLAEPIHYQLTPQQILTLKGTNNVYSDTNEQTEIKYWKH